VATNRYLLIDEDPIVLDAIAKSIAGLDLESTVQTESDPVTALRRLASEPTDLVIIDSAALQAIQNQLAPLLATPQFRAPRFVVMTYYQSDIPPNVVPIYRVLIKPFTREELKQLVEDIRARLREEREGPSPAISKLYEEIQDYLEILLGETSARCILLCDNVGRVIQQTGNLGGLAIDAVTSLISGGIATLLEAGKNLEDEAVINLAYREGKHSDLYAINISEDWILIIIIDRGQMFQRLGSVWYFARKAAFELQQIHQSIEEGKPSPIFDKTTDKYYSDELNRLLS
jgi:CheY-like chemotaxis protein